MAEVQAVSRTAPGNCGGGGSVTDAAGLSQGVVLSEHGGTWGAALPATTAQLATSSMVGTVSCGRTGSCVAGGSFMAVGPFSHALLVSEANGRWSAGREVPGLAAINHGSAEVDSVSCAAPGDCAVAGTYTATLPDSSRREQAFVADEAGGTWRLAQPVPGAPAFNARNAAVTALSCRAPR
ncbi:hypothetical protein EAS64_17255 [Trebonia kvetii]|uniref:Uncharacterized protein n=1 Tax=Trebonia kvetii TaxID=2480626 RepID=A0A6P2C0Y3_9ACTN|nr:hypothetical protein [Trebonia kvetii]TVZ04145.1 hypothetical protein EAS64_17255 [Trebonia kvetii]